MGIGTSGINSYDVTLNLLEDERLWRMLYKGYMGSSFSDYYMDCDDDLYYATKTAIHCLVEGVEPKERYEVPDRVGIGEDIPLSSVKKRGAKVLEVAQKIYEYGINGKESYVKPNVELAKKGEPKIEKINNEEYYVFYYGVQANRDIGKYKIAIDNFSNKTKILNIENKEAVETSNLEFKIAIPIKEITKNIEGTIKIVDAKMKTYPIFYANAYIEEYQDYITYADSVENISTNANLEVNAYQSKINIIKLEEETEKPLEGVKFSLKYLDTNENIGEFTTNEKGEITVTGLRQGKIGVTEIQTLDDYELDTKMKEIELGFNQIKEIKIYNGHKKGELKLIKVDGENPEIKLEGVEFDLIDKNGNVVKHLVTDKNGEAVATDINTGDYILKETKTKEEYKIGLDKEVKITWNNQETLTIENTKKKGKVKIVKQDKDNAEIKLQGVKFNLLNEQQEIIEQLITDENGEAVSSNLPIGKYYLKETETNDNYILNDTTIETSIEEDKVTEVIAQNEKIKGQIKIEKTSEDKNNILGTEAGSPIENAKFNIYNTSGKLVEQIITDKDGIARSNKLEKGKYVVQEVETGKWYMLNDKKYNVEITKNEEIVKLEITNKSQDPKVDISKKCKSKVKANEEIDYAFDIKNTGNVALSNFTWYDMLPNKYAKITKIETGTYNQDIIYSIYYKTNQKEEYMVIKKDLNSKENNYIDLTNLHLDEGEEIIEIKVCFGNVGVGFESVDKPHIFMQVKDGINNDEKIENYTALEGYNQEYKVSDDDTATSIVYNVVEQKKLPRTGF